MKIYNGMMQLVTIERPPVRPKLPYKAPPVELVGNVYADTDIYATQHNYDGDHITVSNSAYALLTAETVINNDAERYGEPTHASAQYDALAQVEDDLRRLSNYVRVFELNYYNNNASTAKKIADVAQRLGDTIGRAEYNGEPLFDEHSGNSLFSRQIHIRTDPADYAEYGSITLDFTAPDRYPDVRDITRAMRIIDNAKLVLAIDVYTERRAAGVDGDAYESEIYAETDPTIYDGNTIYATDAIYPDDRNYIDNVTDLGDYAAVAADPNALLPDDAYRIAGSATLYAADIVDSDYDLTEAIDNLDVEAQPEAPPAKQSLWQAILALFRRSA